MGTYTGCIWVRIRAAYGYVYGLHMGTYTGCIWVRIRAAYGYVYGLHMGTYTGCIWVRIRIGGVRIRIGGVCIRIGGVRIRIGGVHTYILYTHFSNIFCNKLSLILYASNLILRCRSGEGMFNSLMLISFTILWLNYTHTYIVVPLCFKQWCGSAIDTNAQFLHYTVVESHTYTVVHNCNKSALILRASNLILYHSVRVERGCQQWFAMTHLLHYTGLHIGTVLAENHKWLTVALHSGRITHIPICLHKQTSYYDGGVERGCY